MLEDRKIRFPSQTRVRNTRLTLNGRSVIYTGQFLSLEYKSESGQAQVNGYAQIKKYVSFLPALPAWVPVWFTHSLVWEFKTEHLHLRGYWSLNEHKLQDQFISKGLEDQWLLNSGQIDEVFANPLLDLKRVHHMLRKQLDGKPRVAESEAA